MSYSESEKCCLVCYDNDDIVALDMTNVVKGYITLKWKINNAHKGKITSIYLNEKYVLTSSDECVLRIWHHKTQQMI